MIVQIVRIPEKIRQNLWFYLPIISVFILTMGNGFYLTLSTLHLSKITDSNSIVGIMTSAYFIGIIAGSYFPRRTMARIGYIQAFVLYSIVNALITLLQATTDSLIALILIRILVGYSVGALFLIIESWFISFGSVKKRGFIYACYLSTYYAAHASGQLLLELPFDQSLLYLLVSVCYLCAGLAFCVMQTPDITLHEHQVKLSFIKLLKQSPVSTYTALTYGIFISVVYSLLPYYAVLQHFSEHQISLLMLASVIGGTLPQFIVGYLVDHFDSYQCLFLLSLALLASLVASACWGNSIHLLYFFSFLTGACCFSLYSVCISISMHDMPRENTVSTISMLLVTYSIGTVLGPLICTLWMDIIGSHGYFYTLILFTILLSIFSYGKHQESIDHLELQEN